ncbi:hypothetical protein [uncultured Paraglaciecola sp.]|uniref:hypothetical protein n=1 Tax=uncultured Paraglaciecola sp. TaxID=1765024 RepID=UPI0030DAC32C|tara:strand:- start:23177 stop:24295 length:1119 start_codon:yes stop_codon:yes gene_type:complete
MKQHHSLAILLGLLLMTLTFAILAKPSTPLNPQTVVASWDVENSHKKINMTLPERLAKVTWHIDQSQYPGQENKHYGRARALLKPFISDDYLQSIDETIDNNQQIQLLYLWARVMQHQHQFALAEKILNQAQKLQKQYNTNVTLLKASVQLAQGDFAQAKKTCGELIGQAQLVTAAACTLEASAQLQQLPESYQQMTALLNNQRTFAENSLNNWLLQITAEMALHLDLPNEAQQWLEKGLSDNKNLHIKPLSFTVLWADVQLALGQPLAVLRQLGSLVDKAGFKDDALLSRLAIAETHTAQTRWQSLFKKRVNLRIARNDVYHAADIARYYIYVRPNAIEALYWASLNWQQAKLNDDKILLEKAKIMQSDQL